MAKKDQGSDVSSDDTNTRYARPEDTTKGSVENRDKVTVTVAKGQLFAVHETNDYGVEPGTYEAGTKLKMTQAQARAFSARGLVDYDPKQ